MNLQDYQAFKQQYPVLASPDAVFEMIKVELAKKLSNLQVNDELHHLELLGAAMRVMPKKHVSVNGTMSMALYAHWLETKCMLPSQLDQDGNFNEDFGEPAFIGKIWFRTDKEIPRTLKSISELFDSMPVHIGGGGYSTFGGPWNSLGIKIEKLNVGVPWKLRGELSAYAFDMHFFKTDMPGLDQLEVMYKLQDKEYNQEHFLCWETQDQLTADIDLISSLEALREKLELAKI